MSRDITDLDLVDPNLRSSDGRLRRIFTKLDVTTRVELTAEYARLGR